MHDFLIDMWIGKNYKCGWIDECRNERMNIWFKKND